jgi:hypothetical protein
MSCKARTRSRAKLVLGVDVAACGCFQQAPVLRVDGDDLLAEVVQLVGAAELLQTAHRLFEVAADL